MHYRDIDKRNVQNLCNLRQIDLSKSHKSEDYLKSRNVQTI